MATIFALAFQCERPQTWDLTHRKFTNNASVNSKAILGKSTHLPYPFSVAEQYYGAEADQSSHAGQCTGRLIGPHTCRHPVSEKWKSGRKSGTNHRKRCERRRRRGCITVSQIPYQNTIKFVDCKANWYECEGRHRPCDRFHQRRDRPGKPPESNGKCRCCDCEAR